MKKSIKLMPIKTRILTKNDNIVDAVHEYGHFLIGENDVVCIAETVVAITQGRYTRPEDLKPSWQARLMNRFVPREGSMSSIYGMQAAMEEEGEWRTMFWFIIGAIAKLFGKNGVWYAHCRQASFIDDVTGTVPPFDKAIVYGPANADQVCEQIKERVGAYGVVIADVNDLKRSTVVGRTSNLDPAEIARILIDNPFGNASEKTPIVVIQHYAAAAGHAKAPGFTPPTPANGLTKEEE